MLKYRLISGSLMGAAVLLALFFMPAAGLLAVLVLLACLGQLEFYSLMDAARIPVYRAVGTVWGAVLIVTVFAGQWGHAGGRTGCDWVNLVITLSIITVFVRQFPQKHNERPLETIAVTIFGILYVPLMLSHLARLAFGWGEGGVWAPMGATGRHLIIYLLVVVKFTDIGAYTVGRLCGKHKFFPRISPKKTWEGIAGGVLTALACSCLLYVWPGGLPGMTLGHAIGLGLVLSVAGIVGDLFESLVKRAVAAKDSSSIIPGMGGLLDVIDSLLFGAPILYLYTRVFLS